MSSKIAHSLGPPPLRLPPPEHQHPNPAAWTELGPQNPRFKVGDCMLVFDGGGMKYSREPKFQISRGEVVDVTFYARHIMEYRVAEWQYQLISFPPPFECAAREAERIKATGELLRSVDYGGTWFSEEVLDSAVEEEEWTTTAACERGRRGAASVLYTQQLLKRRRNKVRKQVNRQLILEQQ